MEIYVLLRMLAVVLLCSLSAPETVSTIAPPTRTIVNDLGKGMLYPRDSETRETRSLDGIWDFVMVNDTINKDQNDWHLYYSRSIRKWPQSIPMPVPSSYNDITVDKKIRDHVGLVWYSRSFYVPQSWNNPNTRVWLRFGSVHYLAMVYVNGESTMTHEIGHLPFEKEVTEFLKFGSENLLSVACSNNLWNHTVPQGSEEHIHTDDGDVVTQTYTFDFFNYAGIHRPVVLYTTPKVYIDDITVVTTEIFDNGTAELTYDITVGGLYNLDEYICQLILLDADNADIASVNSTACKGAMLIENANLWWPYLMHDKPAYLYTLRVSLLCNEKSNAVDRLHDEIDVYHLPVGLRTLNWKSGDGYFINSRPIYFRGFGRHEDSDIRGKGLDLPTVARDYNLLKWVGANAYRTSHYPYAEEIMDFADREGFMIIDECPSVDTDDFNDKLLAKHKQSLSELIRRDKNRPSVVIWSIANEPRTYKNASDQYFKAVADHVHAIDQTRPITLASFVPIVGNDLAGKYLDIISFNRYNSWYVNPGRTDMITIEVITEAREWNSKYNKLVLMSEYGADTISGLHTIPSFMWSEEYQTDMLSMHFKAFDQLKKETFFIGEFLWNFADFKTAQGITRVGGNKKGIFTRQRQPKAGAFVMRRRYWSLAHQLDNATLPDDLFPYVVDKVSKVEL